MAQHDVANIAEDLRLSKRQAEVRTEFGTSFALAIARSVEGCSIDSGETQMKLGLLFNTEISILDGSSVERVLAGYVEPINLMGFPHNRDHDNYRSEFVAEGFKGGHVQNESSVHKGVIRCRSVTGFHKIVNHHVRNYYPVDTGMQDQHMIVDPETVQDMDIFRFQAMSYMAELDNFKDLVKMFSEVEDMDSWEDFKYSDGVHGRKVVNMTSFTTRTEIMKKVLPYIFRVSEMKFGKAVKVLKEQGHGDHEKTFRNHFLSRIGLEDNEIRATEWFYPNWDWPNTDDFRY